MVHAWSENEEEVVEEERLVIEVELQCSVVEFNVRDLCNDVLEVRLLPSVRRDDSSSL